MSIVWRSILLGTTVNPCQLQAYKIHAVWVLYKQTNEKKHEKLVRILIIMHHDGGLYRWMKNGMVSRAIITYNPILIGTLCIFPLNWNVCVESVSTCFSLCWGSDKGINYVWMRLELIFRWSRVANVIPNKLYTWDIWNILLISE